MSRRALAMVARPDPKPDGFPAVESPYLDSNEAVQYLKIKTLSALYFLMREHACPYLRMGGRLRFDKRDLDAWLRGTTAFELRRQQQGK